MIIEEKMIIQVDELKQLIVEEEGE